MNETKRQQLIDRGIIRPGKGNAQAILDVPPVSVPTSILAALLEERAGDR